MKNYFDSHPFVHSAFHAILSTLIVILPFAMKMLPAEWQNMTLSGLVLFIVHWLENSESED